MDATADPSGHRRQYIDLIRAIRTGTPSSSTFDDAITALATVCSAYVSVCTGRAATLSALLDGEYDGISMRAVWTELTLTPGNQNASSDFHYGPLACH